MIDEYDNQLEVMEQRLRELWAVALPKSALADEDRAVAAKLLGKEGAKRLAATRRGERYRYRPQAIQKIEYHFVPAGEDKPAYQHGWRMEATQNGERRTIGELLTHERCRFIVGELKARGYRVELVITEPMKRCHVLGLPQDFEQRGPSPQQRREPSKRFAILDQLRDFRP